MTYRTVVLILFIATLASSSAWAMLPPDAKAREPQLRAYYQQVRADYETGQAEWKAERARAREQVTADISTPPWLRGKQKSLQVKSDAATADADKARKRIHRILLSIMFLFLIGGGAGWVWYKTREVDE